MFSDPVIGEKFFGREEVLELLDRRTSALKDGYRQNIALTGHSLSGKSSIIQHFLHTIKEDGFIPVYIEVAKESFRLFANKFITTMLYNALMRKGENAGIEMGPILDKASKIFPKTSVAIKHAISAIDKNDLEEAYTSLLGTTSVLKEEANAPCIVILDEFDNLEHLGIKNPFLSFGKVIMVQKDTMYIVSSSRDQAIKKILSEKLSLLFGNFEIVKISSFDFEVSRKYIEMKLAGFEIAPQNMKFIIALTGGNPFYLDKLTGAARNNALEKMTNYIDEDVLAETVQKTIYDSSGIVHQYLMNFILVTLDSKYREAYLAILLSLANNRNKQQEIARFTKIKSGEVSKGLERMLEMNLISKNGVFFTINDVMLEFWLKNVYQRKKEILVDGAVNKGLLFSADIKSHIMSFTEESSKNVIVRIAELINLFSNELVQIESKQMRLPHFTKIETKSLSDQKPFIVASSRGKSWVIEPHEKEVCENDITAYIRNIKSLEGTVANKVIITLRGIDENAKLLAKELKISLWDMNTINTVLRLYGKTRIIIL